MNHTETRNLASTSVKAPGANAFAGFHPLTANFLYCPNQFLDICLKSNSRGMIRIVTYILRQTLGWLDSNGQPINETVKVTYRELIQKAGVSRGAIGKAISFAVASGFVECRLQPRADSKSNEGQSGEYTLKWDDNPSYATTIAEFGGFYSGEGYRTQIPNAFFDELIPNEPIAVIKVVGAVIRHTVGYRTQFGGRRMSTPLSITSIQNYCNIDRKSVVTAIQRAEKAGYIQKVSEGVFSHKHDERIPAVYSIKWLNQAEDNRTGSKIPPAKNQFKISTSGGSKIPPANRFKNSTSIEKTKPKDILKQQPAAAESSLTVNKLIEAGFSSSAANALVEKRGAEVVERQLNWIDARNPKNLLGLLRKAIEEDWDEPEAHRVKQKIAQARIRDTKNTELQSFQDSKARQKKQDRIQRKKRLMEVWQAASSTDRARWIELAAKAESAAMLRDIIRRQSPSTHKPHFQVLDELARELSLPTIISQNEKANSNLANSI